MIDIEGKEHLLDAIFEYCEDIITVKDLDLKYIAYNKAFLRSIIEGDEKLQLSGSLLMKFSIIMSVLKL